MNVADPPVGRTEVRFEDGSLLRNVFGAHDRNLTRLEREFGVEIASRGDLVTIAGDVDEIAGAEQALSALYSDAAAGRVIDETRVRDAARAARRGDADAATHGPAIETFKRPIQTKSPAQARYVEELRRSKLTFGIGPAGTGKTFLAVAVAVEMMKRRMVDRIILSRPAVEAGEKLGFLPGDLTEKVDPYLRPLKDALLAMMPAEMVERRLANQEIEAAPLAFMRGRTLSNAFIILDEAQNTTPMQMKMALTRIGQNARMVVTGDPSQTDLPPGHKSGLTDALDILPGLPDVAVARFTARDVEREDLVAAIVAAYDARARRHADASRER